MKKILKIVIPLASIGTLTFILQVIVITNPERIANWLASFGPWFLPVYILLQAVTIIIPPIASSFIWLAMLVLLGPLKGMLVSYLVTTPLYVVNYILARKYGRPIVMRIIGVEAMAKVDDFARRAGTPALLFLKIFEGGYFDYISYAAGLTRVSFKNYLIVNFLGGVPSHILNYLILVKSPNYVMGMILLQLSAGFLVLISLAIKTYSVKYLHANR